jgi:hypothetical protein
MIRPVNFGFNEQTAESNAFQVRNTQSQQVQEKALNEFNAFVKVLEENGVNVIVVDDTPEPHTPDSIFPNNWVSFHESGDVYLYPMQAANRRLERREDIILDLEDQFKVKHIIDLSRFEHQDKYLEGTGSMVLDRVNKIAYACISPRTDLEVLDTFCRQSGYKKVTFYAEDQNGKAIYHTNVLMCVGTAFAVICLECITDKAEKESVVSSLTNSGKDIVNISFEQMNHFAGNMLEIKNFAGDNLLVMSENAYTSLTPEQKQKLEKYCKLVYANIDTIENNGGGSARCMIAEVHLPVIQ